MYAQEFFQILSNNYVLPRLWISTYYYYTVKILSAMYYYIHLKIFVKIRRGKKRKKYIYFFLSFFKGNEHPQTCIIFLPFVIASLLPPGGNVAVIRVLVPLWNCTFEFMCVDRLAACVSKDGGGRLWIYLRMSTFNRHWCYGFMTNRIHVWVAKVINSWFICHISGLSALSAVSWITRI